MDISDRLEVKVIEAADLKLINGVKPNPYIDVVCGLDSQHTKHVTESTDPKWNQPAMVFSQLLAVEADTLLVYVKHKDIFGSRDSTLGVALIPLDTVYNAPKIEIEDWYLLTESSDMNEEASGKVHVIMTYWSDSDIEMAQFSRGEQDSTSAPNLLEVNVVQALELGGPNGSSIDSFVIAQVFLKVMNRHRLFILKMKYRWYM